MHWAELQQPPLTELSEGGADKIGDFAAESLQVSPRKNYTRDALGAGARTDLAHACALDGPGKVSMDLFYIHHVLCY